MDSYVMARDVEVLQAVMDSRGVTVAALANQSGYAQATIYKYLSDEGRTLPSEVIRAAYAITQDPRLAALVTGDVAVGILILGEKNDEGGRGGRGRPAVRIPPFAQALPGMLKAIEALAKCGAYHHEICADEKYTRDDIQAFNQFDDFAGQAMKMIGLAIVSAKSAREAIEA